MSQFNSLEELIAFNQQQLENSPFNSTNTSSDDIFKEYEEELERGSDIDGLTYFERITQESQPSEFLKRDWDNYYADGFADTFLPKVSGYEVKGARIYDGAKVLRDIRLERKDDFLPLFNNNKLTTVVISSFPKGVEAENKMSRVSPNANEVATFIVIDSNKKAQVSFKFGSDFSSFLQKSSLSALNLESEVFSTDINQINKHFNKRFTHRNVMEFVFKTIGVNDSSAYGNSNKGKLESLLKKKGLKGFIYKNKCNNGDILVQGTIINGWLDLKYITITDASAITSIDFTVKDNFIVFQNKDAWVESELPIAENYLNNTCPDTNAPITNEEINHISELVTAHIKHKELTGNKKVLDEIKKSVEKQLNNPFYEDVKLCVNVTIDDSPEPRIKRVNSLDGDGTVTIQYPKKFLRDSASTKNLKECDITLNFFIGKNGDVLVNHIVSPDYLKEFNYWPDEIEKRGLDVDLEELRKQVIKDLEDEETSKSFTERFIQTVKASLNDKIGGYVEAIQATQKIARNVWDEGQINESTWHSNTEKEEHKLWPSYVRLEPVIGGGTDGVVDEIVGIPMAIKGIYGISTDPKQREQLLKLFSEEGLKNVLDGLEKEVEDIQNDSQKAQHFGAKITVGVVTMFFGVGFITKGGKIGDAITTVTSKAAKIVSGKVMKTIQDLKDWFKYKPKKRKIIDDHKVNVGEDKFIEQLEEISEDTDLFEEVKTKPQQFVNGKKFENNIEKLIDGGDPNFLTKIADEAGIPLDELNNFTSLKQVQINLPDGGFTVADNVWVKVIKVGDEFKYDVIINECKLSKATEFTKRQKQFIENIGKPDVKFKTRSKKDIIDRVIPQGSEINIKSYIRTSGSGVPDKLDDILIEKIK